jgi:hypothetical protein
MNKISAITLLLCFMLAYACSLSQGKHLFILSGQSNMEGMHYEQDFSPYIEQAFGKDNVIIVWDAKGGMPISHWYKNWRSVSGEKPEETGELYNRLMAKVDQAINGQTIRTVTFIWMQGETDARDGTGDVYEASLYGLIDQLQADLKRDDLHVVIGRISDYDLNNEEFPHWTMIRDIQVNVAESNPRYAWIDTDDLNDGLSRRGEQIHNGLHYSKRGYELLGKRFADKAISLLRHRE